MKTSIKYRLKGLWLIVSILLTTFALVVGCAGLAHHPDPLAGWKLCFDQDPSKLDKAIQYDYQDYIQKLPPKEKKISYYAHSFEDGTGRHAVTIRIDLNGTEWTHVLIYDNGGKRIKTIRYISGHYRS
jgi:hypothetical protein